MFLVGKDNVEGSIKQRRKVKEESELDEQVKTIIRKRLTRFKSKKK